jgi:hypothetical protein
VKTFEVGMLQTLFYSVSLFWVEDEHFGKQVQRNWIALRVQ